MTRHARLAALALLCAPVLAHAQTDSLDVYFLKGTEAYQAQDFATYERLMIRVVDLAPAEYTYRYLLARAHALNANAEAAAFVLHHLLNEGYSLALYATRDPHFESLRETEAFTPVQALLKTKTKPLNRSAIAFTLPERDLVPEGMAYDPSEQAFYIGSLEKCKIVRVDRDRDISDFTQPRQDDLVPVLGMKVDLRRRHLWVATSYGTPKAALPENLLGTTGLYKYDLESHALIKRYMLPQEEHHYLNDVVIARDGDVYATDWTGGAVYHIPPSQDRIEKLTDLEGRPNGIALSPDEAILFVAGDDILTVDIDTGEAAPLRHPPHIYLSGDGLYFHDNSLIAIQNGACNQVTRFFLNAAQDSVIRAQTLEAYHPSFDVPTTGALVGDELYYIANSQLGAYDEKGHLPPPQEMAETHILRVKL